jgi:branched-chain amino acid transport system ATP-binding protein
MIGMEPHNINHAGMVRVFQTPEIFPELSLLDNVMIPALAKRDGVFKFNPFRSMIFEHKIRDEAMSTLADFSLDQYYDQHAGSISRGDKRRLELAMGLVQHPTLLLLDEPTAGMARHDTNRTIELLKSEKMQSMTKVIIEHDMHVVFSLADRISVLARGHIIATGTPEEIKNSPQVKEAYLGESDNE